MTQEYWPNFFIIGGPRCGTTSLNDLLNQHPDIFMSKIKEPHFFSSLKFNNLEQNIFQVPKSKQDYLQLFRPGKDHKFRGESSTYYLFDSFSPQFIKSKVPNAKAIVILRDPIERAFSHYLLHNRRGPQEQSFTELIYDLSSNRNKVNITKDLIKQGQYYKHISNYLRYFEQNELLILFFEDLKKKPLETLRTVAIFLGADIQKINNINILQRPKNAYSIPRNKFFAILLGNTSLIKVLIKIIPRPMARYIRNNILLKNETKPTIPLKVQNDLEKIFKPEIIKLEELLKRDCSVLRKTWNSSS